MDEFCFSNKKYGFSLVIGKFPARNRAARCTAPTGWNIFLTAGDREDRPYVFSRAYFETLGGRVTDPPLRRIQKPSVFNVGAGTLAGPQMYAARPGGRALQCRDLHGRPHGAAPTKWVATCPLIRLAFARHLPPKWKTFGRLIAVLSFRRGRSQTGPREGHTPGWLLSAFGRFTFSPSPTVFKKLFRIWVGEPPEYAPGAFARQTQARKWSRIYRNFG